MRNTVSQLYGLASNDGLMILSSIRQNRVVGLRLSFGRRVTDVLLGRLNGKAEHKPCDDSHQADTDKIRQVPGYEGAIHGSPLLSSENSVQRPLTRRYISQRSRDRIRRRDRLQGEK